MGFYGFSFMDLLEHEYVEETTTHNKPAGLYIKKFQGRNRFLFYQTWKPSHTQFEKLRKIHIYDTNSLLFAYHFPSFANHYLYVAFLSLFHFPFLKIFHFFFLLTYFLEKQSIRSWYGGWSLSFL